MWKLIARGERGSPFTDLGSFPSINDAAQAIVKAEADPSLAIFFRVYVDPLIAKSDDATVLSRLEYQSGQRFYLLTRQAN